MKMPHSNLALRFAAIAFCGLYFSMAHADELRGRIVSIADGDTLTLLDSLNAQHKIRIAGIDAPEKAQPFGEKSKQNMARLTFQKNAVADCPKRDRYGRKVCTVTVDGVDVGFAQLEAGLAWWYRKYAHEQLPQQRQDYEGAEVKASVNEIGLWQEKGAITPWDWRLKVKQSSPYARSGFY